MAARSAVLLAGLLALAGAVPVARAQAGDAPERAQEPQPGTFGIGPVFEYSSGKFGGTQATDIWSVGVTGRYETQSWVFRATAPFVHISGPGNVVPTGGGTPVCREAGQGSQSGSGLVCTGGGSGTSSTTFTESGPGDVTLAATLKLLGRSSTSLDFTAKVKVPTADETKGLGTGEFDYSLQGDLTQAFGGTNVFGTAGYRRHGDPPGIDLKDVFFGAVGVTFQAAPASRFGFAYDYRQATYSGGAALNEVSLLGSTRISNTLRLSGYVFTGLTDGGPDWGAGATLLFTF